VQTHAVERASNLSHPAALELVQRAPPIQQQAPPIQWLAVGRRGGALRPRAAVEDNLGSRLAGPALVAEAASKVWEEAPGKRWSAAVKEDALPEATAKVVAAALRLPVVKAELPVRTAPAFQPRPGVRRIRRCPAPLR